MSIPLLVCGIAALLGALDIILLVIFAEDAA